MDSTNLALQIYNGNDEPIAGLVLRKYSYESVVMSLGDKITGELLYNNNNLVMTMREYVVFNDVHFLLVTPPTIVRNGTMSEGSGEKGMTKYSFTFMHPMYILGNIPFSDIAVTPDESKYLSENKTFSWIGKPQDFVNKLNKNLEATEWVVEIGDRFPQEKLGELSEVLSFDKQFVADALKAGYDQWKVPYIVSSISEEDERYQQGKKFLVTYGLPTQEIYATQEDESQGTPFVFRFGQGVGLKNNSRTPRNNKIVTRISPYGSERNIPYGYPQIPWYGDQRWEYTAYKDNNPQIDAQGKPHGEPDEYSFPLYMGILGGRYVKLIKHPFTRTTLMPSIYRQCLFNKVSPYMEDGSSNPNYNKNTELVDYYDAHYSQEYHYVNEIDLKKPSHEIHEFENVYPRFGEENGILGAVPINDDMTPADAWVDDMDDEGKYIQSYFKISLPIIDFDLYACASITEEMQINMRQGSCLGCTFTVQVDWEDYKKNFYDEDGNFMPDGEQRDLEKYPKSNIAPIDVIVQKDLQTFGKIMPNAFQVPVAGDKFVFLGISLPEEYISNAEEELDEEAKSYMLENNDHYFDYPLKFDEFFLSKNKRILEQMKPNSIVNFLYAGERKSLTIKEMAVKFGYSPLPQYDIVLTDNVEVVLNQLGKVSEDVEKLSALISLLRQTYSRGIWRELADKLSRVNNDSAQGIITFLRGLAIGSNGLYDIDEDGKAKLSNIQAKSIAKIVDGLWSISEGGNAIFNDVTAAGTVNADTAIFNKLTALTAHFFEMYVDEVKSVGGQIIVTAANARIDYVEKLDSNGNVITDDGVTPSSYKCYFKANDGNRSINNNFEQGDQAIHYEFNTNQTRSYWRVVTDVSSSVQNVTIDGRVVPCHWVVLSNIANEKKVSGNDTEPNAGDDISQLGYNIEWGSRHQKLVPSDYLDRMGAHIISAYNIPFIDSATYLNDSGGMKAPLYVQYNGINSFTVGSQHRQNVFARNGNMMSVTDRRGALVNVYSTLAQKADSTTLEAYKRDADAKYEASAEKLQVVMTHEIDGNYIEDSWIEEESSEYGFAQRKTSELREGEKYTLSANGHINELAESGSYKLRIYIWLPSLSEGGDWRFSQYIDIDSVNEDETKSVTFTATETAEYYVTAYMYPIGGLRDGKVTLNWVKLEIGEYATEYRPDEPSLNSRFKMTAESAELAVAGVNLKLQNGEFKITGETVFEGNVSVEGHVTEATTWVSKDSDEYLIGISPDFTLLDMKDKGSISVVGLRDDFQPFLTNNIPIVQLPMWNEFRISHKDEAEEVITPEYRVEGTKITITNPYHPKYSTWGWYKENSVAPNTFDSYGLALLRHAILVCADPRLVSRRLRTPQGGYDPEDIDQTYNIERYDVYENPPTKEIMDCVWFPSFNGDYDALDSGGSYYEKMHGNFVCKGRRGRMLLVLPGQSVELVSRKGVYSDMTSSEAPHYTMEYLYWQVLNSESFTSVKMSFKSKMNTSDTQWEDNGENKAWATGEGFSEDSEHFQSAFFAPYQIGNGFGEASMYRAICFDLEARNAMPIQYEPSE